MAANAHAQRPICCGCCTIALLSLPTCSECTTSTALAATNYGRSKSDRSRHDSTQGATEQVLDIAYEYSLVRCMVVGLCFIVLSLLLLPSLLPGSLSLSLSCRRSLPPTCTQATMSEGEARIRFSIGTEQSGKADGVFSNPRGLAFDHHRRHLFVVDCNNRRVQVFSSIEDDACGGEFLSAFSSFAGSPRVRRFAFDNDALLSPWGIAIDHDHDRLVLADSGNHRVQLWSLSELSFLSSVGQRGTHLELRNPLGVAIDKHHDRIVITDTYNHRLVFLSSLDLSFLFEIGKHGSQPGEFFVPTGVAIDHDRHRIIVSDTFNHRVQVLSLIDGSFLFQFGSDRKSTRLNSSH